MYLIKRLYEIKDSIDPEAMGWIHILFDVFLLYIIMLLLYVVFFMGSKANRSRMWKK